MRTIKQSLKKVKDFLEEKIEETDYKLPMQNENMETAFRTLMRTVRQTVDSSIARQCRFFSYRLPEAAVIVQRRIRLSTNVAAHSTRKKYCITQSPHMRLMVYFTFVSICRLIGRCSELRRITSLPLIWRI